MPLWTQNQNANLFLSLNFRFITQSNAFEYFAPFSLDCWEHFEPFYGLVDVWAEWKNTLCKGFGNISLMIYIWKLDSSHAKWLIYRGLWILITSYISITEKRSPKFDCCNYQWTHLFICKTDLCLSSSAFCMRRYLLEIQSRITLLL